MLRIRVIPVLLLIDDGLYKTIRFKDPRYIGDPINAVKIFNEKEVDELVVFDISSSEKGNIPYFDLIENIATECFMPICYGGGISTLNQASKLFRLGVEKISVNTAAINRPEFVQELSVKFGKSSIVITIDVKKDILGNYYVYTNRGKKNTGMRVEEWVKKVGVLGAGEIIINNIERDGTMVGYDTKLLNMVSKVSNIPIVACGGAGKLEDFGIAVREGCVSAVAAGSLFVYWGRKKGILINYPERKLLEKTFRKE
jgi:cyclase